jgi:hypothetical protein
MHQQPNMKIDKDSLTMYGGSLFYMSRSPIPHVGRRIRVRLGYELLNDYAEYDDGNLSNRSGSVGARPGPSRLVNQNFPF